MNVSLTTELERRIAEKVESGLYTTASEVVREGLRLLFSADSLRAQQLERLNADLQLGLDQLDRGESITGEELARELDALLKSA
ncbi:type II toxin-antitoxin system ParD family antitoxin [Caulobacter sp. DWR2-3-1b2]|uniref:type II toxin-antitoxin system ParD family antitoxin n=1 Tax=unclassified Caulobacter TaxID=2648921 RepID=UPI0019AE4DAB|nr:type II toxin-antitoxin system ParD family antitoxin [Caulobacter sp.]